MLKKIGSLRKHGSGLNRAIGLGGTGSESGRETQFSGHAVTSFFGGSIMRAIETGGAMGENIMSFGSVKNDAVSGSTSKGGHYTTTIKPHNHGKQSEGTVVDAFAAGAKVWSRSDRNAPTATLPYTKPVVSYLPTTY